MLQPSARPLQTYVKDSIHALIIIDDINQNPNIQPKYLFTMDVTSLITCTPHSDGLKWYKLGASYVCNFIGHFEYILVQLYKKPMPEIYIGYIDANSINLTSFGARCSSVIRAFAHGAMGRRIDPSWGGPIELFLVPASFLSRYLSGLTPYNRK